VEHSPGSDVVFVTRKHELEQKSCMKDKFGVFY